MSKYRVRSFFLLNGAHHPGAEVELNEAEAAEFRASIVPVKEQEGESGVGSGESAKMPAEILPPVVEAPQAEPPPRLPPVRRYRVAKKFTFLGRQYRPGEIAELTEAQAAEIDPNRIDLENGGNR